MCFESVRWHLSANSVAELVGEDSAVRWANLGGLRDLTMHLPICKIGLEGGIPKILRA